MKICPFISNVVTHPNTNNGKVAITEFFKSNDLDSEVNLPLMEKIKMIDTLGKDEQNALFKMIDLAIANKKMKDNLKHLLAN